MALAEILQRRVRARKEEDDDGSELSPSDSGRDDEEGSSGTNEDLNSGEEDATEDSHGGSTEDEDGEEENEGVESPPLSPDPKSALSETTFGALASAQASLNEQLKDESIGTTSRKRRRSPSPFHEAEERQAGKKAAHPTRASRPSKHAPTELSSKKAVSRKRGVVILPKVVSRDPRFSALSGPLDMQKVQQKYGFLNDYRASEMADLKKQIKETRDPDDKEMLKRELRAMEDRERARKRTEEQKDVLREHRRKEKELVKEGKTPYFLKKGELKKKTLEKRFEDMGEKKAEKLMERRRKKKAGKERKSMPSARRTES